MCKLGIGDSRNLKELLRTISVAGIFVPAVQDVQEVVGNVNTPDVRVELE